MLGFLKSDSDVGLYAVASKMKWILLSLITSISTVLLPRLSFYFNNNDVERYKRILSTSISYIFLLAIPISTFLIFMAKDSILLLSGENYISATLSMQILMPILIISGFSNITGNQILIPKNREKYFMYAVIVGAILNFVLNLFLIPKYDIIGASIATLLAEFSQMTVQYYFSRKYLKNNIDFKTIFNIIISTIGASITLNIYLYFNYDFTPLINLIISSIIFSTTGLIILYLKKEKIIIDIIKIIKLK